MKKIIAIVLCLVTLFSFVACSCNKEEKVPVDQISVTGKKYKVDLSTVNIAWDEGKEPSSIKQMDFISSVKQWYKDSTIEFTSENTFSLGGTNNALYDIYAENCERIDNELYKELRLRGKVDVMVYENKVTFLCDFFLKGWGMYLSIDYILEK